MTASDKWRKNVHRLKIEIYTLYLAYRHPQVPWYARVWAACVVAYAFSPFDLIPDFIPVLGHLDDLIIVPMGVVLARKMIPRLVLDECRLKAEEMTNQAQPTNWKAAAMIVVIWVFLVIFAVVFFTKLFSRAN